MTLPDSLYLALIALLLLLDYFVLWPTFLRRSEADPSRARLWLWSGWMIMLWTLVAAGVALWLFEARAWEALRLVIPHGWQRWGAIGLVLALAIPQARTIARSKRAARVKLGNPLVGKLSPHTRAELVWWVALSLSAGFGEEFVFRGYLIWVLQPGCGLWGAAAVAVVAFALAHAYQGAKGVLTTGLVGSLFTLVVLTFGSLLPAMAVHALIDIGQGVLAWLVLRKTQGEGDLVGRS